MTTLTEKYVNLFTDYGFKRIFGEKISKDLLLDFLNELLFQNESRIVDLTYLKKEKLGATKADRSAIFDLYCENEKGEKFIVELQKSKQAFFKDRALYYSTFPIQEQAKKAEWNFELKAIYLVAILDFVFDKDESETNKYRYDVKLTDIDTNIVFYDKLTFTYLEMPKFNKKLSELKTRLDKWLYAIKNLHSLEDLPDELGEKIFERLFELAELAKFTPKQLEAYEDSLKYYRDLQNSLDTATEEGFKKGEERGIEKGIEIGKEVGIEIGKEVGIEIGEKKGIEIGKEDKAKEIAIKLIQSGFDLKVISKSTGLSVTEIEQLKIVE